MKGDIAVAGFMLTAEEWQELDPASRAQLVTVITRREDAPRLASGTGPISIEVPDGADEDATEIVTEDATDLAADCIPDADLDGAETTKYR